MKNTRTKLPVMLASALVAAGLTFPQTARAHCDTMDGPVVMAAKAALQQNDVTPVLKWVKPEAEIEIKSAFAKTLVVRTKGPEARELADRFFFETLVRVHRAGEGAPFTGLKPPGTKPGQTTTEFCEVDGDERGAMQRNPIKFRFSACRMGHQRLTCGPALFGPQTKYGKSINEITDHSDSG